MPYSCVVLIILLSTIPQSFCLNALFIGIGAAGHVTPLFELAKAMNKHNVTFLTQQMAQSYIDLKSYSSSSFRVVYDNDSSDALIVEKNREQQVWSHLANRSLLDALIQVTPIFGQMSISVLNKTIHILMSEQFDVIVASRVVIGVSVLCEKTNTPCVMQQPAAFPNIFDFNVPNVCALLSSKDLTQFGQRIYNVVFTIRIMTKMVPKLVPALYKLFQSIPRIPGPFYDIFTLQNFRFSQSKCLNLISMPPTFFTPSYSYHHTKYLGAFVNETLVKNVDNDLTRWIKAKPFSSILYGAFGSSSLILHERMYNLISGLATFLLQTNGSSLVLGFLSANYLMYQTVLKDLVDVELRDVLNDDKRVRIENGFVNQKWILQQDSVKVFLSHCGMGSCLEALYFTKPILCMPFTSDQFANGFTITNLNVGQSLLVPPSMWQSLIRPYDFYQYTFTASSVTNKLLTLWSDAKYEKAAQLMSLEMKHAGGLKRAVEEIEFFVNLHGDLDRFAPFQSTLSFYQRYMLDILFIFTVLPGIVIIYITLKCCKRRRKQKTD
ncbi:unnamed protein product [Didymodactylos carnosus]|uniref:Glucuronosyltransferase n=1 Tax=Didymodactylos carnosus TaxID=1234261 RepID=A0A814KE91_9BILA|nr:unnamed protein product [Didymodactylos carnosus]CAF1050206.1 unnamed protein product [Didymodactylos carnosus]CAF3802617.1 unnamed protein product [Didymodactylos carnosus]CAF3819827.1 unnamed protein product [Didymodactylos carnosus]